MTNEEAIKTIMTHVEHWHRLLRDKICDETEGKETIEAFLMAIEALNQNQWIPCEERLPEDDTDVLISYRYKEGEGDTRNIKIDITSYGTMYFGGNAVRDYAKNNIKYWRPPFQYFNSNYEVIAWMPLPKAYEGKTK